MVVLGILGLILLLSSPLWVDKKQRLRVEMKQQLRFIATRIQFALNNPSILQASTSPLALSTGIGNNSLLKCIMASQIESCPVADLSKQETFNLVLPFSKAEDSKNLQIIDQHIISGDDARPVRYRLEDGTICSRSSSDSSCNLEARTYFWLSCQPYKASKKASLASILGVKKIPSASQCNGDLLINFRFQLVYKPLNNKMEFAESVFTYPKDEIFWASPAKRTGTNAMSVTIPTVTLQTLFKQDCAKFSGAVGTKGNPYLGSSPFFKFLGLPAEWRCAQS